MQGAGIDRGICSVAGLWLLVEGFMAVHTEKMLRVQNSKEASWEQVHLRTDFATVRGLEAWRDTREGSVSRCVVMSIDAFADLAVSQPR